MGRKLTAEARAEQMRRIRKTNTKPELAVRRLAHFLGYRFRLHRRDLPGSPDIVFPAQNKVIMVHGCFWHQHPGCRLARQPKSRPDYWPAKLARNVKRDEEVRARLAQAGWQVLTIWECETTEPALLRQSLIDFLGTQ